MNELQYGLCEGDICNRHGCRGTISEHPVENCSCHINPPCSECTKPREFCPICGWETADDVIVNDAICNINRKTGVYRMWMPRPLDKSRIDWRTLYHTNFTQICEGCYPEGTTVEEVRCLVNGTFGGRFEQFGEGKFRFVAYTD